MQREQAVSGGGPMPHTGIQLGTHGIQVRTDGGSVRGRPCLPLDSHRPKLGFRGWRRGRISEIVLHPPLHRPGKKKPRYSLYSGVFNARKG